MHKMNKRENVRAAVDLHCLGLTYPQLHAAQSLVVAESDQTHQSAALASAMPACLPACLQSHARSLGLKQQATWSQGPWLVSKFLLRLHP